MAEQVLMASEGEERSRLARDSYTYLHFPIVISVIFIALGLKKVLEYVADAEAHQLSDSLTGVPLVALYVGVAVHLIGHVAFRPATSAHGTPTAALPPCSWSCCSPSRGSSPRWPRWPMVAGVLEGLVGYEAFKFRVDRDQVRHHER